MFRIIVYQQRPTAYKCGRHEQANKYNISAVAQDQTAKTQLEFAEQRAQNIAKLNVSNVLELCVGPSLKTLEQAYSKYGIKVTGNDIDIRWKHYYPLGNWIIGDALNISYNQFDMVVFAPPLSVGCSGKRNDALDIDNVQPNYYDFINKIKIEKYTNPFVLVLPARSLATRTDRNKYYKLISFVIRNNYSYKAMELKNKRNIRKYIDLYCF